VNILLIHQYFLEENDPGGSRFNEMAKVWISQGHTVTVICGMVNYVTGKTPEKYKGLKYHQSDYAPGLRVIRCFVSSQYNVSFIGRLWAYFSFVWYGSGACLFKLKKEKFSVILATSPPLFIGLIAWVASKAKRIPYVFEIRDLWPESAIDTGVLTNPVIIRLSYYFEKLLYKNAFLINVLTPAFRKALIEKKKVPGEKIIFIPNACDFSLSDDLLKNFDRIKFRDSLGWQQHFILTYVGAHGVANHLVQLLDVADRLRDTNLKIVLIGDGMQKQALNEQAVKRGITNVLFIDPLPKREVMKYILASDAGASVLKKVEAFNTVYSNKTFDYMACQKPILMVIDGVSRQLVEEAGCGVYAEPENIDQIEHSIRYLMNKPQLCEQMGLQGYIFAQKNFDRYALAGQYMSEIEKRLARV
jgi:glycosyltransferase involved in cell wall biosynthesis